MTPCRFAAFAALALALSACEKPAASTVQGWVEADFLFVGPDEAGRVETLSVREGDGVEKNAPLFTVDDELQRADVMQNMATVTNARQTLDRADRLLKAKAGTEKAFDDAQQVLREAEAKLHSAQTRLARRKVVSPAAGVVHQVYYRPGEIAPAGRPVIALLPPANIKVRFFVPEGMLPQIAIGDTVRVRCDGCPPDLSAKISFIAQTAEFTPPVIYSLEERAKLVFLVEARPEHPDKLRVGQPVDVAVTTAGATPKEAKR